METASPFEELCPQAEVLLGEPEAGPEQLRGMVASLLEALRKQTAAAVIDKQALLTSNAMCAKLDEDVAACSGKLVQARLLIEKIAGMSKTANGRNAEAALAAQSWLNANPADK